MKKNLKNGFSLIELSIVLIIIGLLVAGIVGGVALIISAKSRTIVSEINNYQQAVASYYSNRMRLPGDVNGSGKIGLDSYNDPVPNDYGCNSDVCAPFIDLSSENIIAYDDSINKTKGKPSKVYKKAYYRYIYMYKVVNIPPYVNGFLGNAIELDAKYHSSLQTKVIRAVDEMIDDGLAYTGNMRASCFDHVDIYDNDYDIYTVSYDQSIKNKGVCSNFVVKLNTFN